MKQPSIKRCGIALAALGILILATCGTDPREDSGNAAVNADAAANTEQEEISAAVDVPTWISGPKHSSFDAVAAVQPDGAGFIAWLQAEGDGPPRLMASRLQADAKLLASPIDGEHPWVAGAALALDSSSSGWDAYVVFEAQAEDGTRALFGRSLGTGANGALRQSPLQQLGPGLLMPTLVQVQAGRFELIAMRQGARDYEFVHMSRAGAEWSAPEPLSLPGGDQWRPRAVPNGTGAVHLVYDVFDGSSFDVRYARLRDGKVEWERALADGAEHQAFPEPALAPDGRLWVAYETAPQFGEIGGLRTQRSVQLCVLDGEDVRYVDPQLTAEPHGRADLPRLHAGPEGLTVTWRTTGESWHPPGAKEYETFYSSWYTRVLSFDAQGRPLQRMLRASDGDNRSTEVFLNASPQQVANAAPALRTLFAADLRTRTRPHPFAFEAPIERNWRLGLIDLIPSAGYPPTQTNAPKSQRRSAARPIRELRAPLEASGALPQTFTRAQAEPSPRALVGDLHRHTQLSRCQGVRDGILLDVFRYARGPGALDFVALTDHYQHLTPWSLWRSLRDTQRFHVPGRLVVLGGIERMLRERGHANEIYADPLTMGLDLMNYHRGMESGPKTERALAIPHMTGRSQSPMNWEDFRPQLHRLFEVYQGLRGAYEGEDMPFESFDSTQPESTISAGLARGHHFGLIASSDHKASSTAYAGVWSESFTRDGIFDALAARRTFGASVVAAADLRLGGLLAGQDGSVEANAKAELWISAPAPVAAVELVVNGKTRERLQGEGSRELLVLSCRRSTVLDGDGLTVRVAGGRLLKASDRTKGESGAELVIRDGTLHLSKGLHWIDVLLEVERSEPDTRIELALKNSSGSIALDAIQPGRAQRGIDGMSRESLWRIGPPLSNPGSLLKFETSAWSPGDTVYARVSFQDGNRLWTSPLRIAEIER